jgi:hypothetical protein
VRIDKFQVQRRGCEYCCKLSDPTDFASACAIAEKVACKSRLIVRNLDTGDIAKDYSDRSSS